MHHLRFRQVHLDFHTSPIIPGIGQSFNKEEWQETLKKGHVNSITLFAKCHHGWHYHLTKVGRMHPNLGFDLLREQFDACKELDINVPIYLSAGLDDAMLDEHPEWQNVFVDSRNLSASVSSPLHSGFHHVCFNSPYTDYLVRQIRETLTLFPNCNGIFLDIISQPDCCCVHCMKVMRDHGWNPLNADDRRKCMNYALERYYQMTTNCVTSFNPDMPIFHNSGHVTPGRRDLLSKYFSHLELESLPTGGWGYDHFPLSAKYVHTLDFDFLGMTGKFHTTWGEFGGFKHPNALRYECDAMLAYGAKCSIGDQLHPSGKLDESTYELIGEAYADVEKKEAWCDNVKNVAEIGLLIAEGVNDDHPRNCPGDVGAGRILLEGHFLFDVIDAEADFSKYRLLILPNNVKIDSTLRNRLASYVAAGGKLLLSGSSGLDANGKFLFDVGAECEGLSPFRPDYACLNQAIGPDCVHTPMVMYLPSTRIKVTDGIKLGDVYDPYFNRTDHQHFCSHQHTPYRPTPSGYAAAVRKGNIMYLAHPVFSIYYGWGSVPMAEYARKAIRYLLGEPEIITNLPSTARLTLMEQPEEHRYVLHLLYASTVNRGSGGNIEGVQTRGSIEVIEDLLPLHDVKVDIRPRREIKKVTLAPEGTGVLFNVDSSGRLNFKLERFTCHQMVVLEY